MRRVLHALAISLLASHGASAQETRLSNEETRQWAECIGFADALALYNADANIGDTRDSFSQPREREIQLLEATNASVPTHELLVLRLRAFHRSMNELQDTERADIWKTDVGKALADCGRLTDRMIKLGIK